ncbi:hypothetical protein DSO57_1031783 [Entomophthora muscae]|uniref:Uncharacterized protein n=1 Tax=Entomophthora muscae TaxID=34485 RepID=A0ACC2TMT2_9FUNG|nr:hypothetical protein DSO57_1031783 [Entomophthora muscae]
MFAALYESFTNKGNYFVYSDAINFLNYLKGKKPNIKLVVISYMDERLEPLLESLGISHYFSSICSSRVIGVLKPNSYIFHAACRKEGVDSSQALHIGDDYSRDYLAAIQAGYQAYLLNRSLLSVPERDKNFCISSLDQLTDSML